MSNQPTITKAVAEDHYWSETLNREVYSYQCPHCQTYGVVSQLGDVIQCTCGAFLRVTAK